MTVVFCLLKNDHNSHISQEDLLGWEVLVSFDQVVDSLETPLGEGKIEICPMLVHKCTKICQLRINTSGNVLLNQSINV